MSVSYEARTDNKTFVEAGRRLRVSRNRELTHYYEGGATDSGAGAVCAEEIGGEAEEHDDDGGDEITVESRRGRGRQEKMALPTMAAREDEDEAESGIAGNAVGIGCPCEARRMGKMAAAPSP